MNTQFFEDITKQIGRSTTRREMIIILSGTLWGSFMMSTFGSCKKDEKNPASDPDDPPSNGDEFGVEILTAEETQQLKVNANQDLHQQAFQTSLAAAGTYKLLKTEGAKWIKKGLVTSRTIISHYQESGSNVSSYLVYGTDGTNTPLTILLRSEPDTKTVVGIYRDQSNEPKVEMFNPPPAPPNTSAIPNPNYTDVCKMCLDTCNKTNLLRPEFCVTGIVSAAIQTAITMRAVWQALKGPGGADAALSVALKEAFNSSRPLQSCTTTTAIDCDNVMCKDLCKGCSSTNSTCSDLAICINGECRQPCGDGHCRSSEKCSDGICVPLNNSCSSSSQSYVGSYRSGNVLTPSCCPFIGKTCGATLDGSWGGCCPTTTNCKPIGIGYGCCIPGLC